MIEATRRAKVDRWIITLNPLLEVVKNKAASLRLADHEMIASGPALLPRRYFDDLAGDRIRKGHVWWVKDHGNCGFHVDFCANRMTHIEAWTGKSRRTSTWISDEITPASLKRDLTVCLVAAGLTDLARSKLVRAQLFSRTAKK